MGRLAWRRGRSRAPFRPWRAAHRPRVRHRGRGMRHASPGRTAGDPCGNAMAEGADGAYRTGLVRRRKPFRDPRDLGPATFRRVSWRGPEASAPVLGPQDTGTDRNRVLREPNGASRPTIRAEQKQAISPASFGNMRRRTVPGHDPADRLLRDAGLERGLDPAVPAPALGGGERPGHLRPEPGVSVSPGPGVAAAGGRPARCRAGMSLSRANTPAPTGRSTAVFCQVVIGQCGVSFPSEKAVGFSPVRNWPVIARVLLFHCIRA